MNFVKLLIKKRKIVIPALLVGSCAIILGYDYLLVSSTDVSDSVSQWITSMSHKYPAIPFTVGFFCGHFFFSIDYGNKSG